MTGFVVVIRSVPIFFLNKRSIMPSKVYLSKALFHNPEDSHWVKSWSQRGQRGGVIIHDK